ncbi:MAG: flippase [Clostridia bacterium]|nr:flippase [Clostridia bacterium]
MILPFITAPYIARVLGAENVGIYSYTYTLANYFVLFSMLGLNNHGSRLIAQIKDDKKKLNITFSSLFLLHFLISLGVLLIYVLYVSIFEMNYYIFLLIQGINIIASVIDINWLYFGLERFKTTVVKNSIIKVISVVCVLVFVNNKNDLIMYILIMTLANLLSQIVLWKNVKGLVKFVKPDKKIMISSIKPMIVLFIAVIATSFYRSIDKIMLGKMNSMVDVGCYENADKIIMFPISLITALGTVMLPRMSMLYKNKDKFIIDTYIKKSIEFSAILAFSLCFGLMAIGESFSILFFGEEFQLTGEIIKYLAITIPIIAFNNVIRTQYIIPNNRDNIYVIAVLIGAIFNFVINYFLIPILGVYGAVIGTIASYVIVFMYQNLSIRKEINIIELLKYWIIPLIDGIVMYCVVSILGNCVKLSITNIVMQILLGAFIYIILIFLFLYKNEKSYLSEYISLIKNKLKKGKKHDLF